jgi:hypothetical protein
MADLWWNLAGAVFAVVAVLGLVLLWAGHKDRWPR